MIYTSDDYIVKYCDTFSYLLSRSHFEGYSFDFVQRNISYSLMINELEKSNVTRIAFSSMQSNYRIIFPDFDNNYNFDAYDAYGWIGYIYMHLFLHLKITFEALFFVVPIEKMLKLYRLYHEMDISQMYDYVKSEIKYSLLDVIMKTKKISNQDLFVLTGIPASTISALRYSKRDISKLEASKLLLIANALNVKMETLLPTLHLKLQSEI